METYKAPLAIVQSNLAGWKKNDRVLAGGILTAVLLIHYVLPGVIYGIQHGENVTIFFLPAFFSSGILSVTSFKVLFFFCTILLFCNAPFMNEQKLFLVQRSGRRKWWQGEWAYIVVSSFLYLSILNLAVMLMIAPCANWDPRDWGTLIREEDLHPEAFKALLYNETVVNKLAPISAWLYTFLTVWADMIFLGLVVYAVNLRSKKNWLGIAFAAFFVLLEPMLMMEISNRSEFLLAFSPISWSDIGTLRAYRGKGISTIPSVIFGIIICITVLTVLIAKRTEKMDIVPHTGE